MKSFLAVTLASALVLTSSGASSNEYFFRYKPGVTGSAGGGEDPPAGTAPLTASLTTGTTWRAGENISIPVSISGGMPAYTVLASGVPYLSYSPGSGIAGSAEANAPPTYSRPLDIHVEDSLGATTSASTSVVVYPELSASVTSPAPAVVGDNITITPIATGVVGTASWSLSSANLSSIPGLSLNPSTGVISGTPTAAGEITNAVLRVTDSVDGKSAQTALFSLSVKAPMGVVVAGATTRAGEQVSIPVAISGGTAPYFVNLSVGSLTYNQGSGRIIGTAPAGAAPTYVRNVAVDVTDDSGRQASTTMPLTVYPVLTVTVAEPDVLEVGSPVSIVPTALGLVGTPVWSIGSGSLSGIPGLNFDPATGRIYGTPSSEGSVSITLRLEDSVDGAIAETDVIEITSDISESVVTLSNAQNVNIQTLFAAADWTNAGLPKRVIVPAGVIIGSSSTSLPAMRTGTGLSGALRIDNQGSIQGAGGQPNGGVGGNAFVSEIASGVTLNNTGSIYAGGGGGGKGGVGGTGNSVSQPVTESRDDGSNQCLWQPNTSVPGHPGIVRFLWNGAQVGTNIGQYTLTVGGFTYTCAHGVGAGTPRSAITRTGNVLVPSPGGAGGNGGRGQGYGQSRASGLAGAAASNSAGTGGTGGIGGNWGSSGTQGAAGAAGSTGAGTSGIAGGTSGYAVTGAVTYTGSGQRLGR